jgi:MinD-like ATPase involved in chromosome partitioning or flagellar assembly
MAIVAIVGDAATTTSVALAAAWPIVDDAILVEADPEGGDLAAWFDMAVVPSLSTVVTSVLDGSWSDIDHHTRSTASGLRVLPAPPRAGEAEQAVGESARSLVPTLASLRTPVTIVDAGRVPVSPDAHPFVAAAAVTVLVHRQSKQSARAAAVRLQRLADRLPVLLGSPSSLVVAVIGSVPFDRREIDVFISEAVAGALLDTGSATPVVSLPIDELAAAVFAGRTGVSARRFTRLPLVRSARDLAAAVRGCIGHEADMDDGVAR